MDLVNPVNEPPPRRSAGRELRSGFVLTSRHLEENAWTVNLPQHLPTMCYGQPKSLILTIFTDRERGAFLYPRGRPPAHRVAFVDFAVSAALGRPADTDDAGSVARVAINYTPSAWFIRNLGKSLVKFIAVLAGQILCLSLSTRLSVAEQFGIHLPISIPANGPSVSET